MIVGNPEPRKRLPTKKIHMKQKNEYGKNKQNQKKNPTTLERLIHCVRYTNNTEHIQNEQANSQQAHNSSVTKIRDSELGKKLNK